MRFIVPCTDGEQKWHGSGCHFTQATGTAESEAGAWMKNPARAV
jgi:hypothetical protein